MWKIVWRFLKKLETEPPCDPATTCLGMDSQKLKAGSGRNVHPHVYSNKAHNSRSVDTRRCPPVGKRIAKGVQTYSGGLLSLKKDPLTQAVTWAKPEETFFSAK